MWYGVKNNNKLRLKKGFFDRMSRKILLPILQIAKFIILHRTTTTKTPPPGPSWLDICNIFNAFCNQILASDLTDWEKGSKTLLRYKCAYFSSLKNAQSCCFCKWSNVKEANLRKLRKEKDGDYFKKSQFWFASSKGFHNLSWS